MRSNILVLTLITIAAAISLYLLSVNDSGSYIKQQTETTTVVVNNKSNTIEDKPFSIGSIDKTSNKDTTVIYLIFNNPTLSKTVAGWRINISIGASTIDNNGKIFKQLTGAPLQTIDEIYSYEPDAGSFIFNITQPKSDKTKIYKTKFTITDHLSGKTVDKEVTMQF